MTEEIGMSNATATQRLDEVKVGLLQQQAGLSQPVLISEERGGFNGSGNGMQLVARVVNANGADLTISMRVWVSNTGHTVWGIAVYELTANQAANQSRVNWFLEHTTINTPKK